MWGKKKIMLICSSSPTTGSFLQLFVAKRLWSCILQLARCQGTIITFSVSPLAKLLMHVLLLPSSFCLSLQHQPQLHMWETLKCECSMMWPNSHVENFVFLFSLWFMFTSPALLPHQTNEHFFFFVSNYPPFCHPSYSFTIAVWHLALARHSQVNDQCPPVTRIYGSISLQLII